MRYLIVCLAAAAGYLVGSLNGAIIVTQLTRGKDIRTPGNRNPGTANVGHTRPMLAGTFAVALLILFLNITFLVGEVLHPAEGQG